MCAGALSAGAQREAVLRPLSLPIPLQVHMCFISRPAHRTVNSNGGLAWGYSQPPGRDGKTAGKKWQVWEKSSLLSSLFLDFFFFFSVSLSLSSLSFAVLAPCSVFALRFVFGFFFYVCLIFVPILFVFRLAGKFSLDPALSVSHLGCLILIFGLFPGLFLPPRLHPPSNLHCFCWCLSMFLSWDSQNCNIPTTANVYETRAVA